MLEVDQSGDRLFDDVPAAATMHVANKCDSTGVVLIGRVIKALGAWNLPHTQPSYAIKMHPRPAALMASNLHCKSFNAPTRRCVRYHRSSRTAQTPRCASCPPA